MRLMLQWSLLRHYRGLSCLAGSAQSVCESAQSCCTLEMETKLRLLVRKDFQALLHHNSRSLEGLLASTAAKLQGRTAVASLWAPGKTLICLDRGLVTFLAISYCQKCGLRLLSVSVCFSSVLTCLFFCSWAITVLWSLGCPVFSVHCLRPRSMISVTTFALSRFL